MEHIETLVEAFPNVQFNILAHTNFAPSVIALEAYSNVSLYPRFTRYNAQAVLDKLDFYLDINYHEEIYDIIQKVTALNLSFLLMLPIIVRLKGIVTVFM